MKIDEFKSEIQRLSNNYGERHFSQEKVNLLWQLYKNETLQNFHRAVDHMILNTPRPPLLKDFSSGIAKAREHSVKRYKQIAENDAKQFMRDGPDLDGSDPQYIEVIRHLKEYLSGRMSEYDWDEYMLWVKKTYSPNHVWDTTNGVFVPNSESPPRWQWLVDGVNRNKKPESVLQQADDDIEIPF